MNCLKHLWRKSFDLHRMNDCDDLNFYYKKFLNKLSKICLKIFLPLLLLINLFTLFLCRLFLSNQIFDIRTKAFLILTFFNFILLLLIRLHTKKEKTLDFNTFFNHFSFNYSINNNLSNRTISYIIIINFYYTYLFIINIYFTSILIDLIEYFNFTYYSFIKSSKTSTSMENF